jgi:hypothetical protein
LNRLQQEVNTIYTIFDGSIKLPSSSQNIQKKPLCSIFPHSSKCIKGFLNILDYLIRWSVCQEKYVRNIQPFSYSLYISWLCKRYCSLKHSTRTFFCSIQNLKGIDLPLPPRSRNDVNVNNFRVGYSVFVSHYVIFTILPSKIVYCPLDSTFLCPHLLYQKNVFMKFFMWRWTFVEVYNYYIN